jgi:CRISPR-associated endonuclease/helicase Cas3
MAMNDASALSVEDFDDFYYEVYRRRPFAWQKRLAAQVCREGWPDYIKLPTSSGKTTVIDIAVFSLAYQAANADILNDVRPTPRRIFFVVDRRIVVNEAYQQARRLAEKLRAVALPNQDEDLSESATLRRVATQLQKLASDSTAPPLDCFELRGGIFRNDTWVRSLLQPTILTTTVDQIGSRLLFRGYGVSDRNLPIHAALTANDSLIILDEAHCSQPFSQTIERVQRYRSSAWSGEQISTPFAFVQMTATPPSELKGKQVFTLSETDYEADRALAERHGCVKPTSLHIATGAKGSKLAHVMAKQLCEKANALASEGNCKKVAVIVNRVHIARECFDQLSAKHPGRVDLMIGAMRPIDRDSLTEKLQSHFGSRLSNGDEQPEPRFVVSTQCIEVGADFDFDGMVSQCASLDALRQRFGRLNRLGQYAHARGDVVIAEEDLIAEDKLEDEKLKHPIYGHGLAHTWYWLNKIAKPHSTAGSKGDEPTVDFGIWSMEAHLATEENRSRLLAPTIDAQVLMPAHVDMLCQTSPRPFLEPDVSAYLHGLNRGEPEVRVCWRADLEWTGTPLDKDLWNSAVSALPPAVGELLSVKLRVFKNWLKDELKQDESSDVLGELIAEDVSGKVKASSQSKRSATRRVLAWRGMKDTDGTATADCELIDGESVRRVRPFDIVVIPVECGGWEELGYVPEAPKLPDHSPMEIYQAMKSPTAESPWQQDALKLSRLDIAEQACLLSRAKTVFRAHKKLRREGLLKELSEKLLKELGTEGVGRKEANWSVKHWKEFLVGEVDSPSNAMSKVVQRLTSANVKSTISVYQNGIIWITDRHPELFGSVERLPEVSFDGDDLNENQPLSLLQHTADVFSKAVEYTEQLSVAERFSEWVRHAALVHDIGKADPRFQARLRGKPMSTIYMLPELLAKSGVDTPKLPTNTLPSGFRHETVSLSLLDYYQWDRATEDVEVIKHLVATHHGFGRPFLPCAIDEDPPVIDLRTIQGPIVESKVRKSWRIEHQVSAGQAERFWKLNRRFGWWGVAWLEAMLRLADWNASAEPNCGPLEQVRWPDLIDGLAPAPAEKVSRIELIGIDGSNPLGYLAALGCIRTLTNKVTDYHWKMQWENMLGGWRPVITSHGNTPVDQERFLVLLQGALLALPEEHPALRLSENDGGLRVAARFDQVSKNASRTERDDADWLTCNGSDLLSEEAISQLQTSRRDYHSINIRGLLKETSGEHLKRSLFQPWDYADGLAGVSLHLEPREDRRHAYQWHQPSGDPTRGVSGGMIGANRLALEAWPLFQSLPDGEKLSTVGFHGTRVSDTKLRWCLWDGACDLATIQSLLNMSFIHEKTYPSDSLRAMGIPILFNCSRILVGKTPNLTPAEAVQEMG